jgi:hypothetical protein
MPFFIIPTLRLIFHFYILQRKNYFIGQNVFYDLPDFLQIDRLCCLSKDDGKSRCRVFLVESVHVRKSW